MRNKVYAVVCNVIDEINEQHPDNPKIKTEPENVLFGIGGALDSLGLVNLIVAIEQSIEDEFDINISLANEKAMSQRSSPFRTIDSLTKYIVQLLKEAKHE